MQADLKQEQAAGDHRKNTSEADDRLDERGCICLRSVIVVHLDFATKANLIVVEIIEESQT